jgi:hypothetical protein
MLKENEKTTFLQKRQILINEWCGRIKQIEEKDKGLNILSKNDLRELSQSKIKIENDFERLRNSDKEAWESAQIQFENDLEAFRKLIQAKYVEVNGYLSDELCQAVPKK